MAEDLSVLLSWLGKFNKYGDPAMPIEPPLGVPKTPGFIERGMFGPVSQMPEAAIPASPMEAAAARAANNLGMKSYPMFPGVESPGPGITNITRGVAADVPPPGINPFATHINAAGKVVSPFEVAGGAEGLSTAAKPLMSGVEGAIELGSREVPTLLGRAGRLAGTVGRGALRWAGPVGVALSAADIAHQVYPELKYQAGYGEDPALAGLAESNQAGTRASRARLLQERAARRSAGLPEPSYTGGASGSWEEPLPEGPQGMAEQNLGRHPWTDLPSGGASYMPGIENTPESDTEMTARISQENEARKAAIRQGMAGGLDPMPEVGGPVPAMRPMVEGAENFAERSGRNPVAGGALGQMLPFPRTPASADWTKDPDEQAKLTAIEQAARGAVQRFDPARAAELEAFWAGRGLTGSGSENKPSYPRPGEPALGPLPSGVGHFGRETQRADAVADALRRHKMTSTGVAWDRSPMELAAKQAAFKQGLVRDLGIEAEDLPTDSASLGSMRTNAQQAKARLQITEEAKARKRWPGMDLGMAVAMEQPGNNELRDVAMYGEPYVSERNRQKSAVDAARAHGEALANHAKIEGQYRVDAAKLNPGYLAAPEKTSALEQGELSKAKEGAKTTGQNPAAGELSYFARRKPEERPQGYREFKGQDGQKHLISPVLKQHFADALVNANGLGRRSVDDAVKAMTRPWAAEKPGAGWTGHAHVLRNVGLNMFSRDELNAIGQRINRNRAFFMPNVPTVDVQNAPEGWNPESQ